ncbi:MAG TPA: hypothetical protein VGP40_03880, partial [Chthoniobacterales bacterium]|nr:hypothetical protein [Chthoniobacterales bacterium]
YRNVLATPGAADGEDATPLRGWQLQFATRRYRHPWSVSLPQNGNRAADNLDTAGGHNGEHEHFVAHFLDNLRRFTKGKSLLDRVM